MTKEERLRECYELAQIILSPFEKKTPRGYSDPLAMVSLAHLLYRFKYDRDFSLPVYDKPKPDDEKTQ